MRDGDSWGLNVKPRFSVARCCCGPGQPGINITTTNIRTFILDSFTLTYNPEGGLGVPTGNSKVGYDHTIPGWDERYDTVIIVESVGVAQGTAILSATLSYNWSWIYTNLDAAGMTSSLVAWDRDDGTVPGLGDEPYQPTVATTASTTQFYQTAPHATSFTVTAIIQEIINRPGWVSGNDITIFHRGEQTFTGFQDQNQPRNYIEGTPAPPARQATLNIHT